jgi:Xaa-Pro aminopeptidase
MAELQIDAIVASSLENVFYLSDALILGQRVVPTRLALVIWPANGEPAMVIRNLEEMQLRADSPIADLHCYVEFQESPIALLAKVLQEKGLAAGRIGLETRHLAARYRDELGTLLPRATFVDADELFDRARTIKSPEEIELMTRAAKATDEAIQIAFDGAREGMTEAQIASTMTGETFRRGGDGIAFIALASGANAKVIHRKPSNKPLARGDVVRTDFGAYFGSYFGGYLTDLARTAVVGMPTPRQTEVYRRLFDVHMQILAQVRPGATGVQLYEICRKAFEGTGVLFRSPFVGHNLGLLVHEDPILTPSSCEPLEPNMVMAIEPFVFDDGAMFHIEDMLVVTETGCRLLSDPHRWSELKCIP